MKFCHVITHGGSSSFSLCIHALSHEQKELEIFKNILIVTVLKEKQRILMLSPHHLVRILFLFRFLPVALASRFYSGFTSIRMRIILRSQHRAQRAHPNRHHCILKWHSFVFSHIRLLELSTRSNPTHQFARCNMESTFSREIPVSLVNQKAALNCLRKQKHIFSHVPLNGCS